MNISGLDFFKCQIEHDELGRFVVDFTAKLKPLVIRLPITLAGEARMKADNDPTCYQVRKFKTNKHLRSIIFLLPFIIKFVAPCTQYILFKLIKVSDWSLIAIFTLFFHRKVLINLQTIYLKKCFYSSL